MGDSLIQNASEILLGTAKDENGKRIQRWSSRFSALESEFSRLEELRDTNQIDTFSFFAQSKKLTELFYQTTVKNKAIRKNKQQNSAFASQFQAIRNRVDSLGFVHTKISSPVLQSIHTIESILEGHGKTDGGKRIFLWDNRIDAIQKEIQKIYAYEKTHMISTDAGVVTRQKIQRLVSSYIPASQNASMKLTHNDTFAQKVTGVYQTLDDITSTFDSNLVKKIESKSEQKQVYVKPQFAEGKIVSFGRDVVYTENVNPPKSTLKKVAKLAAAAVIGIGYFLGYSALSPSSSESDELHVQESHVQESHVQESHELDELYVKQNPHFFSLDEYFETLSHNISSFVKPTPEVSVSYTKNEQNLAEEEEQKTREHLIQRAQFKKSEQFQSESIQEPVSSIDRVLQSVEDSKQVAVHTSHSDNSYVQHEIAKAKSGFTDDMSYVQDVVNSTGIQRTLPTQQVEQNETNSDVYSALQLAVKLSKQGKSSQEISTEINSQYQKNEKSLEEKTFEDATNLSEQMQKNIQMLETSSKNSLNDPIQNFLFESYAQYSTYSDSSFNANLMKETQKRLQTHYGEKINPANVKSQGEKLFLVSQVYSGLWTMINHPLMPQRNLKDYQSAKNHVHELLSENHSPIEIEKIAIATMLHPKGFESGITDLTAVISQPSSYLVKND